VREVQEYGYVASAEEHESRTLGVLIEGLNVILIKQSAPNYYDTLLHELAHIYERLLGKTAGSLSSMLPMHQRNIYF
jgi:hypothetical protein